MYKTYRKCHKYKKVKVINVIQGYYDQAFLFDVFGFYRIGCYIFGGCGLGVISHLFHIGAELENVTDMTDISV